MDTPAAQHNAALVRRLFEALAARDVASADAILSDDVVWHFPGRNGRLAGDHRGKEAVYGFLLSVLELTGGTFRLEVEAILTSDDRAAALFRGSGERGSMRLDNPTCLVMRIADGHVVELWEFVWDLEHVEAFWS